jgi:hypothetical protein
VLYLRQRRTAVANVRLVRIFPQPTTLTDDPGKEMAAQVTGGDEVIKSSCVGRSSVGPREVCVCAATRGALASERGTSARVWRSYAVMASR